MIRARMIGRDRTVWYNLVKLGRHPVAGQHAGGGGEEPKPSPVHTRRNGLGHDQKWITAAEGAFSLPSGSWRGSEGESRKKREKNTKLSAASHYPPPPPPLPSSGAADSPTEVVCWNGPINLLAPKHSFKKLAPDKIPASVVSLMYYI
jgi:hypothetical protein